MLHIRSLARRAALAPAALLALLGALDAQAVPVIPGAGATAQPGTTLAANPALAGTVLQDVLAPWVSADDSQYGFPGAQGELQSRVVRETGTGTLDFYWRVTVDQPSYPSYVPMSLTIAGLSLDRFLTGSSFDADYRIDGVGTAAPTSASATATSLTWSFDPSTFGPGSSSYFLLLHSNATTYYQGAVAELGASDLATFSPTQIPLPVPEPANALLVVAGLAALGTMGWRQRAGR